MKQATFSELRNNAKRYFDIVESGESVRIVADARQCDAATQAGLRVVQV
jgi:hypothetical protein